MNKVAVLMSTYNGEKFCEEQIKSILDQDDVEIHLYIRDDGSNDNTLAIVDKLKSPFVQVFKGNNVGASASFFWLINNVDLNYDYYAFADQDDFWEKNKIKIAIDILKPYSTSLPTLYYSSLIFCDKNLENSMVKTNKIQPDFSFSLVRSIFPGCTMVFNRTTFSLIQNKRVTNQIMHDQFVFQIVSGVNGFIYYDNNSYIKYRQHGNNVSAYNTFGKRIKKLFEDFTYNKNIRSRALQELFSEYGMAFDEKNRKILSDFANYQCHGILNRMNLVFCYHDYLKYKVLFGISLMLGVF